ncbi:pilus assembly protein TadE [Sphingomonas yabuuchiae]|uniref:Pilus assembly protein TadE n=1 Tax=Sphingomonas yabuuchiae TaxID=172044 RepID=A0A147IXS1_9SPHN|nr:TadE/TadG family type IV pilus assembly protein [Sphingomonas yabuuchiae]KTW00587.1 pilus assembly protein TadE [Sphingomonas yabuuchiae]
MSAPLPSRHSGDVTPMLRTDRRGAVIVEFALVAAPFIALLLAILQSSLAYLAQEALESAVEVAARGIVTGQTQAADLHGLGTGLTKAQLAERFRSKGCQSLPSFLSCSRLFVDVQSVAAGATIPIGGMGALNFDAVTRKFTDLSYDVGSQGSLVTVRFIYLWPMPIAPAADLSPLSGKPTILIATSVSKTEAYL